MKLQTPKRLIKEDFDEDQRPLIEKLGFVFNTFADDVSNILNNNLTIEDNFTQSKRTVKTSVNASGVPIAPLAFKSGLAKSCYGIQCVRVLNTTDTSLFASSTPLLSFTETGGVVTINNITGLTASSNYTLSLILYS